MRTSALGTACTLVFVSMVAPLHASPDADPERAGASALPIAATDSLFHIEKSENRNQVHYGVHVDEACRPVGEQPVYAYWRELARGPEVTSPLLDVEQPGYGLLPPRYVRQTPQGGQIRLSLRAFAKRPLIIDTFRAGAGRCATRTVVAIERQAAVLTSIYVDIGFLFSVNYALVRGVRVADGRLVQEKISVDH